MRQTDPTRSPGDRARRAARRRRTPAAGAAVLALAVLWVVAWPGRTRAGADRPGSREVPIAELAGSVGSTLPLRRLPDGLAMDVDGYGAIFLPLPGTAVLDVEYRARGPLLLSWFTAEGTTTPSPHATPWHHLPLDQGAGRLSLDLRTTPAWTGTRTPVLFVEGAGTFELRSVRATPAARDPGGWVRERDEAIRDARLWIGHTTIHFSDPPAWKASEGLLLATVLGAGFSVAAAAGALGWLALRKRWAPAAFLAWSAIAATALGDAAFARRAWPALALRPVWTPEARLTGNLHMSPELGALAALARRTLPEGDRVGVQVRPGDWFGWETLCFHLAPRPCVRLDAGDGVHEGLYGVHRLTIRDVDAVVHYHAGAPLPAGFVPVGAVGPSSGIARRP